jgi:hypothetical protein
MGGGERERERERVHNNCVACLKIRDRLVVYK